MDNVLTITINGTPTPIDLSPYLDNTDDQLLSISGNDLSIENGNTIELPDDIDDANADPTNELQVLSISNDTLYLSMGGFVILPSTAPCTGIYYYADKDNDGFGNQFMPVWVPDGTPPPSYFIDDNSDCDDAEPSVNPGAEEICFDGVDNNCNGIVDEDCEPVDCYNLILSLINCIDENECWEDIIGCTACQSDFGNLISCFDLECMTNVFSDETSFMYDETLTNEEKAQMFVDLCGTSGTQDQDGDGYSVSQGDCDDTDLLIHPGAVEICDDGMDNNCNGIIDDDCGLVDCYNIVLNFFNCLDANECWESIPSCTECINDLWENMECVDGECVMYLFMDETSFIYDETLTNEEKAAMLMEACGAYDEDGDGYTTIEGDCDDTNPDIHPGAEEICDDGIDQNCNGADLACEDLIDNDGDGYNEVQGDCDDTEPLVNPAAQEICEDGIDNNCNGVADEDCGPVDCYDIVLNFFNCLDANECWESILSCTECINDLWENSECVDGECLMYLFIDESSFIYDETLTNEEKTAMLMDACGAYDEDGDGYTTLSGDCDDNDPNIHPGAEEICEDGIDQDCNGSDLSCDDLIDNDGDGYNEVQGDCNDTEPLVNPGAEEICDDGIDNNCNGEVDEDCGPVDCYDIVLTFFNCVDANDCWDNIISCMECINGLWENLECFDGECLMNLFIDQSSFIYDVTISNEEKTNMLLEACGSVGNEDNDGDGYSVSAGDCNDNDPDIHPSAPEACDDGIDNNCNGTIDEDCDPDYCYDVALSVLNCLETNNCSDNLLCSDCMEYVNQLNPECGPIDCMMFLVADLESFIHDESLTNEEKAIMLIDECSPLSEDNDGDGFPIIFGDCDDNDPSIYPTAPEICDDGIDQDCDGNDVICNDLDGDGYSLDMGDCDDNNPSINPGAIELCDDGIDNNCDGVIDTDCDPNYCYNVALSVLNCLEINNCGDNLLCSECMEYVNQLNPECGPIDCMIFLVADLESFIHDESLTNEEKAIMLIDGCSPLSEDQDGDGYPVGFGDCDDNDPSIYPTAPEICDDGIDQDCDGADLPCFIDTDGDGVENSIDNCPDTPNPDQEDSDGNGIGDACECIGEGGEVPLLPDASECCEGLTPISCSELLPDGTCSTCSDAIAVCTQCGDGICGEGENPCNCPEDCDLPGTDNDGDGYTNAAGDCDDSNPLVYPGAIEACDGLDNNCDGVIDEGCSPADCFGATVDYLSCLEVNDCGDDVMCSECDELFFALEQCFDVECLDNILYDPLSFIFDETLTIEEKAQMLSVACIPVDDDGDGYFNTEGDCNDNDPTIYPGATEICDDGIDQDCNGADAICGDNDGDGYTVTNGDCDDNNSLVHPGAYEECDGIDNNCDGVVDEICGFDGCYNVVVEFLTCLEVNICGDDVMCSECDELFFALEQCFDFECLDNILHDPLSFIFDKTLTIEEKAQMMMDACWPVDIDGDGYYNTEGDCDDNDPNIYPGAPEICDDGIDQDCNGTDAICGDNDGDGYTAATGDCDDNNSLVHPGANELCDGIDNNCDGVIDEGCGPEDCLINAIDYLICIEVNGCESDPMCESCMVNYDTLTECLDMICLDKILFDPLSGLFDTAIPVEDRAQMLIDSCY